MTTTRHGHDGHARGYDDEDAPRAVLAIPRRRRACRPPFSLRPHLSSSRARGNAAEVQHQQSRHTATLSRSGLASACRRSAYTLAPRTRMHAHTHTANERTSPLYRFATVAPRFVISLRSTPPIPFRSRGASPPFSLFLHPAPAARAFRNRSADSRASVSSRQSAVFSVLPSLPPSFFLQIFLELSPLINS